MKDEESRCITIVHTSTVADKKIKELTTKLMEFERDKKCA